MKAQLREVGMRSLRSSLIIHVPAMFGRMTMLFAYLTRRTSSGPSILRLGLNGIQLKR